MTLCVIGESRLDEKTRRTKRKVRQMSGIWWPNERIIAPSRPRSRLGVVLVVVGAGIRKGAEQLTIHSRYSQKRHLKHLAKKQKMCDK